MGHYEKSEKKKLRQQFDFISDYSIEIDNLSDFSDKTPLELKEELWCHFDKIIQEINPDAKIYDIQLALNDTGYLDLLSKLRKEKYELQLIEKRVKKTNNNNEIENQIINIKKAEANIEEYKNRHQDSYAVKGFATFTSPEASEQVQHAYNVCCSCCNSKAEYL